jgi:hypothetical protein
MLVAYNGVTCDLAALWQNTREKLARLWCSARTWSFKIVVEGINSLLFIKNNSSSHPFAFNTSTMKSNLGSGSHLMPSAWEECKYDNLLSCPLHQLIWGLIFGLLILFSLHLKLTKFPSFEHLPRPLRPVNTAVFRKTPFMPTHMHRWWVCCQLYDFLQADAKLRGWSLCTYHWCRVCCECGRVRNSLQQRWLYERWGQFSSCRIALLMRWRVRLVSKCVVSYWSVGIKSNNLPKQTYSWWHSLMQHMRWLWLEGCFTQSQRCHRQVWLLPNRPYHCYEWYQGSWWGWMQLDH